MTDGSMPMSRAAANAAVAFRTLCMPGTFNSNRWVVPPLKRNVKVEPSPSRVTSENRNVRLRGRAVSHDPPLHSRNQRLNGRIVQAQNRRAIKRNLVDELQKRFPGFPPDPCNDRDGPPRCSSRRPSSATAAGTSRRSHRLPGRYTRLCRAARCCRSC